MARTYDTVPDHLVEWIGEQHVFFVASAPSGGDGHVNLSPKGLDTFRVLGPTTVGYLDLTGSGAETIAHLRDNGRITLMFCAFDGKPMILRLFGRGRSLLPGDRAHAEVAPSFPEVAGARSIIVVELDRIQTSCGYAVPLMAFDGARPDLIDWAERKGEDGLDQYRSEKNVVSIDGLPAIDGGGGIP